MPVIRSDDGPRKLRAIWLGPKGATLPVEWSYVQWGLALLMTPVLAVSLFVVLRLVNLLDPLVNVIAAVVWGAALAFWGANKAMKPVTFDRPLAYYVQLCRSAARPRKTEPGVVEQPLAPPLIGYLSENALQCIRWSSSQQRPVMRPQPTAPVQEEE